MEYNPGGSVERMRAELEKSGALAPSAGTVPPAVPGVTQPQPPAPVGPIPTPGTPGVVAQPGAVDALGQTIPPAPAERPKTGEPVTGETGPNGEPLFYVVHDGIESKLTVTEMAQDHSYMAHNTRVSQENADKRRELELLETRLMAEKATLLNAGGATFDNLLAGGTPGNVAQPVVAPPVQIPAMPLAELAVENPDEYTRQMAARDQAMLAANNAAIAASVASAVQPLVAKTEADEKARAEAQKQADLKTRQDQQMVDLYARIPELDMNLVSGFMARSSHEDAARFNTPEGYEFIWSKILRGEQPGGNHAPAVVPGYTPPQPAYSAPAPVPTPRPPYAEPGAGGGNVAHAIPTGNGQPMPNMTTAEAVAQAIKNKRAATGGTVYYPGAPV